MEPKRKRVNNEENLQNEFDRLRIELGNCKSQQNFLEKQLLQEEKMKTFMNQQLREKDEHIVELIQDLLQEKNFQSKEIMCEIRE
jgi:hypothetical protein